MTHIEARKRHAAIREALYSGHTCVSAAARFGVSVETVKFAKRGMVKPPAIPMPGEGIACLLVGKPIQVLVDASEIARLSICRSWRVHKHPSDRSAYVRGYVRGKQVYLHCLLIGSAKGDLVDHRNTDGLDNRLENLRFCTPAQNARNRRCHKNKIVGFKGVTRAGKKYVGTVRAGEIVRRLGPFPTPEQAHEAYCKAAVELHGEFARVA